ncbi:MAG TPA: TIGR00730 family Rossman fold protein [Streptosporangiaceae bacterium]|nr:TIGR00730 family Rossman fold protein [Streptosporangiaceae bacterium]
MTRVHDNLPGHGPGRRWAVSIFCSGRSGIDGRHITLATQLGEELARHGYTVVTGGSRESSMGAVARAARAMGGHTLGVTVRLPAFDSHADHEATLIYGRDLSDRKHSMEEVSDAFIMLAGGLGTLDELLHIWTGQTLGTHVKPLIIIDPNNLYQALRTQVEILQEQRLITATASDYPIWVATVGEALKQLESALAAR